ncbi:VOC family protein [Mesorhizobium sp. STM 4661]
MLTVRSVEANCAFYQRVLGLRRLDASRSGRSKGKTGALKGAPPPS